MKRWNRDKSWYLGAVGTQGAGGDAAMDKRHEEHRRRAGAGSIGGGAGAGSGEAAGGGRGGREQSLSGSQSVISSRSIGPGSGMGKTAGSSIGIPGFSTAGKGTFAGTITAAANHVKT